MAASKAQQAETANRRDQACKLRMAGASYDDIARQLRYASRGAAYTDITRALERNVVQLGQTAEVLRQQELERLDRLQLALWQQAMAGDTRSAETVLRIMDRRARVLGLDAPARVEILTLDAIDEEIRRLEAELRGRGVSTEHVPSGHPETDPAA